MTDTALVEVLEHARTIGLLGPGPVTEHVEHARVFVDALSSSTRFFVDLGSGAGVPGLVIARAWPEIEGALLEGSTKRAEFLREAVDALDLAERVAVWAQRAEEVGRDPHRRGRADAVVARSFGPPAVVSECAAPLLETGGILVVSDPPSSRDASERWPADGVAQVGLRVVRHLAGPPAATVLEQTALCPERFPRRVGIPAKRPLF